MCERVEQSLALIKAVSIACRVGGYSPDGASMLLDVMLRKNSSDWLLKQKSVFVEGAKSNGYKEESASWIFDLLTEVVESCAPS